MMSKHINKFYNDLSEMMEKEINSILVRKVDLILVNKENPAQWCQDRMLYDCISQERASKFLKQNHNIGVVLLPEPHLKIEIHGDEHF